jgi:hypothetical protein
MSPKDKFFSDTSSGKQIQPQTKDLTGPEQLSRITEDIPNRRKSLDALTNQSHYDLRNALIGPRVNHADIPLPG